MKTQGITSIILENNVLRLALGTALILLIPLVAMQFTTEVNWDETDFIAAGVLLFGAGLTYELITRKVERKSHVAIGLALLAALILIWAEVAVGIIGA